jgi:tRNA(Arg) A34 adenosine deaminase TadA
MQLEDSVFYGGCGEYVPNRYTKHAEEMAIRSFISKYGKKNLTKATLYLIKLNGNGKVVTAIPCPCCSILISKYNIKKVIDVGGSYKTH